MRRRVVLDRCPICGKLPKIKLTYPKCEYARCNIRCKPLFGKSHISADTVSWHTDDEIIMTTAELWNCKAEVQREAIENCKKLGKRYEG